MSLFAASLNSGSNGNCYYIGNSNEAILIDAGISCRETEIRMKRLGLSAKNLKGIFITHEHSDHISGVSVLSKKYQIPVFITSRTLQEGRLNLKSHLCHLFRAYESITIGDITVMGFPKEHDAADPHSFVVESLAVKVGVFTDIGTACAHVVSQFEKCHAAFLEANYDEMMLETGSYPIALKKRITEGKGHLSNSQSLSLFQNHRHPFLSHLFLSHLSEENNSQRLVKELFSKAAGPTKIIIASRHKESKLYHIRNFYKNTNPVREEHLQLSLF